MCDDLSQDLYLEPGRYQSKVERVFMLVLVLFFKIKKPQDHCLVKRAALAKDLATLASSETLQQVIDTIHPAMQVRVGTTDQNHPWFLAPDPVSTWLLTAAFAKRIQSKDGSFLVLSCQRFQDRLRDFNSTDQQACNCKCHVRELTRSSPSHLLIWRSGSRQICILIQNFRPLCLH